MDNPWNNGQGSGGGGSNSAGADRRSNMGLSSDVPNGKLKNNKFNNTFDLKTGKCYVENM